MSSNANQNQDFTPKSADIPAILEGIRGALTDNQKFYNDFLKDLSPEERKATAPKFDEHLKVFGQFINELETTGKVSAATLEKFSSARNEATRASFDRNGDGVFSTKEAEASLKLSLSDPHSEVAKRFALGMNLGYAKELGLQVDEKKITSAIMGEPQIYNGVDFKQLLEKAGFKGDKAFVEAQKQFGGIDFVDVDKDGKMGSNDAFRVPTSAVKQLEMMAARRENKH